MNDIITIRKYGELILRITSDGKVEFGDNIDIDEAARIFWVAVQKSMPKVTHPYVEVALGPEEFVTREQDEDHEAVRTILERIIEAAANAGKDGTLPAEAVRVECLRATYALRRSPQQDGRCDECGHLWSRHRGSTCLDCEDGPQAEVERLRGFVDFCAHGMVTDQTPADEFAEAVRWRARELLSRCPFPEREMCTTHPARAAMAFTAWCRECYDAERRHGRKAERLRTAAEHVAGTSISKKTLAEHEAMQELRSAIEDWDGMPNR